jgi:hypothetical protein
MNGLSVMSLALSSAGRGLVWSFGIERFGNDRYSEDLSVMGIGFPLASGIRAGLTAKLHRLSIKGYGAAHALGIDIAWSSEPIKDFRIGAIWRNVNRPLLGVSRIKVPHGLIVGLEGELSRRLSITVEGGRVMGADNRISAGFSFDITKDFIIRTGCRRGTGEYSFGSTIHLPLFRLDYAFSVHPVLGITHFISLSTGNRYGGKGFR